MAPSRSGPSSSSNDQPKRACLTSSDKISARGRRIENLEFDGDDALPDGLPADLIEKIAVKNPLETYPRLRETAP